MQKKLACPSSGKTETVFQVHVRGGRRPHLPAAAEEGLLSEVHPVGELQVVARKRAQAEEHEEAVSLFRNSLIRVFSGTGLIRGFRAKSRTC